MELSDKVRKAAFTLIVGSAGFGLGAITCADDGIIDIVQEMRKEAALEREAHREYLMEIRREYMERIEKLKLDVPATKYQPPGPTGIPLEESYYGPYSFM